MASLDDDNARPTVALVAEMIRGLRELTRSEFANMQRQLDTLSDVPRRITELEGAHRALSRDVENIRVDLEKEEQKGFQWKLNLPATVIATLVMLVNVGLLVATFVVK